MAALVLATAAVAVVLIASPQPDRDHDQEGAVCGDPGVPLLLVGDFDADGIVDQADVAIIREVVGESSGYQALYDRNGDGAVNDRDIAIVAGEVGMSSTTFDREIALAYQRFSVFQQVDDATRLRPEFRPYTGVIAGHGVHWGNDLGRDTAAGEALPNFARAEGLNVAQDGSGIWAMYWAEAATPVFEGGATDWPTPGGEWQDQRVIAFADTPPKFTSDSREHWHTHAGLCLFENRKGEREVHGLSTYNECQAYEGVDPEGNRWINIWMAHLWLFELNPNGVWGNTHPCLDAGAPSELEFTDGREIPRFFKHM